MGTRGSVGFRLKEKDYLSYNHWDSYPEWLGKKIVEQIPVLLSMEDLKGKIEGLKIVDQTESVSLDDVEALKSSWNELVSSGEDYYAALRLLQGDLPGYLRVGIFPADNDFILNSLYCEWAYIINLDAHEFEVYRGFQDAEHSQGRYASVKRVHDEYYPCALIATFPLDDIPEDWIEALGEQVHA